MSGVTEFLGLPFYEEALSCKMFSTKSLFGIFELST